MTNPLPVTPGTMLAGQMNDEAKHYHHSANLYWNISRASNAAYILNYLLPICLSISLPVPAGQNLRAELVGGPEQTVICSSYHQGIRSSACVIRQTECWAFDQPDTEPSGRQATVERHDNQWNIHKTRPEHISADLHTHRRAHTHARTHAGRKKLYTWR